MSAAQELRTLAARAAFLEERLQVLPRAAQRGMVGAALEVAELLASVEEPGDLLDGARWDDGLRRAIARFARGGVVPAELAELVAEAGSLLAELERLFPELVSEYAEAHLEEVVEAIGALEDAIRDFSGRGPGQNVRRATALRFLREHLC